MVVMTSESCLFDFGQNSLIYCVGASLQKSHTQSRLLAFGKPASGKKVSRGDNTFDFLAISEIPNE